MEGGRWDGIDWVVLGWEGGGRDVVGRLGVMRETMGGWMDRWRDTKVR